MSYFRRCSACGAYLDPHEKCDCEKETAPVLEHRNGQVESESPTHVPPPILTND